MPKSAANSLQLMKKALDVARKENDKDPFPDGFEDYTVLAYTYINDQGETVTMWLLERDGKRVENKELQDFLEKNGQELDPLLYTNLSGEELERKVNDSWKDGINYLNGQKVSGFSGAVLRSSAYVASMKDWTDDAGLTDMALGLGFGIAAARNKTIMAKKVNEPEVGELTKRTSEIEKRIRENIEASKKARKASKMKEYLKREKEILERIKKANSKKTVTSSLGNEIDITPRDNHTTVNKNPGPFGNPDSSVDILDSKGNLTTRRYYDKDGRAARDVDMTNHGNAKKHPEYPHEHFWTYDSKGNPSRN